MKTKAVLAVALLSILPLSLVGCQSPQEKAMAIRSEYILQLNTWLLQEPEPGKGPLADAHAAADDISAKAAATDAVDSALADDAAIEPEVPAGPRKVTVLFDIVLSQQTSEGLPGLTLDVSQADPFQKEKKTYRHFVELPKMVKGQTQQTSFSIQADDFVDGDVFSVSLRKNIPEAERGEYRELK